MIDTPNAAFLKIVSFKGDPIVSTPHGNYLHRCEPLTSHERFVQVELREGFLQSSDTLFEDALFLRLENNCVAIKKGGAYLCAESNDQVRYSRDKIGEWELFRLFFMDELQYLFDSDFVVIPSTKAPYTACSIVENRSNVEELKLPKSLTLEGSWHYDRSSTEFFLLKSGDHIVPQNTLISAENVCVSTKPRASGCFFNFEGYFHGEGFLRLRSDMSEIIFTNRGAQITKRGNKHIVVGEYIATFDGNSFNYYHWLLEGLLGWFLVKQAGVNLPILLPAGGVELEKFQADYLRLLSIDYLHVEDLVTDFKITKKIFFLKHRELPYISCLALNDFREFMSSKLCILPVRTERLRILIKRKPGPRSIDNIEQVEESLKSIGFIALDLQEMSVQTQASHFAKAEIVIGAHGAGLANMIFCRPNTVILELLPRENIRNCFWLLSEKLGLDYYFLFCYSVNALSGKLTVPVQDVIDLLQKIDSRRKFGLS